MGTAKHRRWIVALGRSGQLRSPGRASGPRRRPSTCRASTPSSMRGPDTYKMSGDLVGDWTITAFEGLGHGASYQGKGRELFEGLSRHLAKRLVRQRRPLRQAAPPCSATRELFADNSSTLGSACWGPR